MKFMYFSIKYRYIDILLKKHKLHLNRLFCCNHTCYCVNMVSVTSASRYIRSASRYHPRYQRDPWCTYVVWFHGILRNWPSQFRLSHVLGWTRMEYDDFNLGLVTRKSVFGVSHKASFKPVSSATKTSQKIEISPVASLHMVRLKSE